MVDKRPLLHTPAGDTVLPHSPSTSRHGWTVSDNPEGALALENSVYNLDQRYHNIANHPCTHDQTRNPLFPEWVLYKTAFAFATRCNGNPPSPRMGSSVI